MDQRKYEYGRDLFALIVNGMFLSNIMSEIKELKVPIDQSLTMHNLYESSKFQDDKFIKTSIDENLRSLKLMLTPRIVTINEHITTANKLIKGLDFKNCEIPKLKITEVLTVIRKRLNSKFDVPDAQKMSNETCRIKLDQLTQKPVEAIFKFIDVIAIETYKEEVNSLRAPYKAGLQQAMHICSIGYYTTSVFIAGKTTEEIINTYLSLLFKVNKLKEFDLSKVKFDTKINLLHHNGFINESLYHKLSSIRIDRNDFGHPGNKSLSKHQAHLRIRNVIDSIPEIDKKIVKLERQKT